MQHKIFKIIAIILVLCMGISVLPNITAEQELESQVKTMVQNELTTSEAVVISPKEELSYVYWNPNEEESTTTDGYTTIAAGNDANDGTSVSKPVLSLEKAIALAGESATIYCMNPYIISGEDFVVDGKEKAVQIIRDKSHAGNIFLVGSGGTLTLRNITLAGGSCDTPIITVTERGKVNIDEAVHFRDETTYAMLEVGAKPVDLMAMPPEDSSYFIALEKIEEGVQIAQTSNQALEIQDYIKLKDSLETANGSFETYVKDGVMQLKKKTVVDTIYLNPNGDDTYIGITPETAVRSFKRAQEIKTQVEGITSITICDTVVIEDQEVWSNETIKRSSGFNGPLIDIKGSMILENINIADATMQQSILNEGKLSITHKSCIGGGIESQGEMLIDGQIQLKGIVTLMNAMYPLIVTSEPMQSIQLGVRNFDIDDIVVQGENLKEEALALFEITSNNSLYYSEEPRSFKLGNSGIVFVNSIIGDNENNGLTNTKPVRNLEIALERCQTYDLKTIYIAEGGAKIEKDCKIPEQMIIRRDGNYKTELFKVDGKHKVTIAQGALIEGGIIIAGGSLSLEGGTITNTLGIGIDLQQGSVDMYEGKITKCKNQAIKVAKTGEFNVYGGTISDNWSDTSEDIYVEGQMRILGTSSITDIIYIGNKDYPLVLGEGKFEWQETPYQISCGPGFANNISCPVIKGSKKMPATLEHFEGSAALVANIYLTDTQSPYDITAIREGDIEAVYINGNGADTKLGVGAGDDKNDGSSIATPVKTFDKAKELVEHYKKLGVELDIIVCGQITVGSKGEWELPEYTKLLRYYAYSGNMVKIDGTTLRLKNITIDGNKEESSISSQAIVAVINEGTLEMQQDACIMNNRNTNSVGGGVHINHATLEMTDNACIVGNIAKQGGGIYEMNSSIIHMNGTANVSANEVSDSGGGIYQNQSNLFMKEDSKVSHNTAKNTAGGIRQNASEAELAGNSSVSDNTTEISNGGGIYQYGIGNKLILRESASICNNTAKEQDGGGIFMQNGSFLEMYDKSSISNNIAQRSTGKSYGGGIYSSGEITLTNHASIHDNKGNYGGGIWLNSGGSIKLQDDAEIYNNSATKTGGGISQSNNTKVILAGKALIRNNQAERGGGIYLLTNSNGLFASCHIYEEGAIRNNNAMLGGGGIWQTGGELLLSDKAIISENMTQVSGGGIGSQNGKLIINGQVAVTENKAVNGGGGIYLINSAMEMAGGSINENIVEQGYGGGLYVDPNSSTYPLLLEGIISGNKDKLGSQITVGTGSSLGIGKGALVVDGSIYLNKDATIKVARSIVYPKALYEIQCANEEGERIVVEPDGSGFDAAQYLSNFSLLTDKCMVLSKKEQNIVIDQVYFIDGENGSDTNAGTTPHDAFATMEKALSIIGNSSATIYVSGTVSITKDTSWNFPGKVQIYRYTGQSILGHAYDKFEGDLIKVENSSTLTVINGHFYGKRSETEEMNLNGSILNISEGIVKLQGSTILANNETEKGMIAQKGQLQLGGNVQIKGTIKLEQDKYVQIQKGAQISQGIILDAKAPETHPVLVKYEEMREADADDFALSEALDEYWVLMKEKGNIKIVAKGNVYLDPKEGDEDNSGLTIEYPVQTLKRALQIAKKTGAATICILNPVTVSEEISLESYQYVQQSDFSEPLFTILQNGKLSLESGCKLQREDEGVAVCVTAGDLSIEDADVRIDGTIYLEENQYITRTNLNKESLLNYQIQMEAPSLGSVIVKYTCADNANEEAIASYGLEDEIVSHYKVEIKNQELRLSSLEGVYVDPINGSDAPSRTAGTKGNPLQSLEQAYQYLQEAGGKIYVMQPMEITSSVKLSGTSYSEEEKELAVIKNNGQVEIIGLCTGYLFKVADKGQLTAEGISIEAVSDEKTKGQLAYIASGGTFITQNGAVLKYNLDEVEKPAIENEGTMTCYGGTFENEKKSSIQTVISQKGTLNVASIAENLSLGEDKVKLAKNHVIQMQKVWQGTPIAIDFEAAAFDDKVIVFEDAAIPNAESAWDQVKYFNVPEQITLVQNTENAQELIIGEALSIVAASEDYFGQIGEEIEFKVRYNSNIPLEKTKISIKNNKGEEVEYFTIDTRENSIAFSINISKEAIGTYTVTAQYMSAAEKNSFVLSGYEVVYKTEENKLIARASRSEMPHADTAKLIIYNGYKNASTLTLAQYSLKGTAGDFEPKLVSDIESAITQQDCFSVEVPMTETIDEKGELEIKLNSSNLLTDKGQGKMTLKDVMLRQSDTSFSKADIEIPFETKAVTGAVIRVEKDNKWIEGIITLKDEKDGRTYRLIEDKDLKINYNEEMPAGIYSIWRGEKPTGKTVEVIAGQLSKSLLKYYTLTLMHNDGTGAATEKEVLNGMKYGDALDAIERENYYFAGYYTAAEGGKKCEGEEVVNLEAIQTLYAHWIRKTYMLEVTRESKNVSIVYGDTESKPIKFIITNKGNAPITELQASLETGMKFELGTLAKQQLGPNESIELLVSPKLGLEAGTYQDQLKLTGKEAKGECAVIQTVQKAVPEVTVTAPVGEMAYVYKGEKLPSLKGTATYKGRKVEGNLSWENSEVIMMQPSEYTWTFVPKAQQNYEAVTGKLLIQIKKNKAQVLSFKEAAATGKVIKDYAKESVQFEAINSAGEAGSSIQYRSSNEAVATVDALTGKVNFKGVGETVITAYAAPTIGYNAGEVSYTLEIMVEKLDVTTQEAKVLSPYKAQLQGAVINEMISESGFYYKSEKDLDYKKQVGLRDEEGSFSLVLENLSPQTVYSYYAYAKIGRYMYKGNECTFKTLTAPSSDDELPPSSGSSTVGISNLGEHAEKEETVKVELGKTEEINNSAINEGEVPYYVQDGERVVIGFSMALHDTLQYMAPPDQEVYIMNNPKYFKDIEKHWAKPAIDFITAREVFVGVTDEMFRPDGKMTRGMIVTVLGRLYERSYGVIAVDSLSSFDDVSEKAYYAKYIAWAKTNGLIEGRSPHIFAPNVPITREEFAKIIYGFSKKLNEDVVENEASLDSLQDRDEIAQWAVKAVAYCIETSLMVGNNNSLRPRDFMTRAECAQVLKRYIEMIVSHNC